MPRYGKACTAGAVKADPMTANPATAGPVMVRPRYGRTSPLLVSFLGRPGLPYASFLRTAHMQRRVRGRSMDCSC